MSPIDWKEFDPPENGLNAGETVEWTQNAGVSFVLLWCGMCLPLLTVFLAFFILSFLGDKLGTAVLAIIGITILYLFYLMIQVKRTKYYITSQRLLEVRGGFIRKEIPLENLKETPTDECMKVGLSHDEGAYKYYNIRIIDPVTGTFIRMTSMREDALEVIRKLSKRDPK